MKKWIIIALLVLIGGYAVFATLDARGVDRTCAQALPTDESGKNFKITNPDGSSAEYQMPDQAKIIGLATGEKIGFSYQKGRFSGFLYEEQFYLLSDDQKNRVYEFDIQQTGRGAGTRAAPVKRQLEKACP